MQASEVKSQEKTNVILSYKDLIMEMLKENNIKYLTYTNHKNKIFVCSLSESFEFNEENLRKLKEFAASKYPEIVRIRADMIEILKNSRKSYYAYADEIEVDGKKFQYTEKSLSELNEFIQKKDLINDESSSKINAALNKSYSEEAQAAKTSPIV